jgi:tetratricopeptide (TPR) repeat protein
MPQLSEARNNLGMLTLQMSRLDEARTLLDEAFKADPYHLRVSNMRKVIKVLDSYGTISTDHFVIRYDTKQDELLARRMSKFLEEDVHPQMVKLFGFEPPQRTTIEIYSKGSGQSAHEWFSARMIGLPWVQTIGASTGMMIAMASPNGLAEPYNWARVIRHEYVHVVTLQQTGFNIPHWYTEALAVRNEGYPRPVEWNDMLRERVPKRDLRDLSNLNLGFIRAKNGDDWNFAYCQSDLYADYFVKRFGEDSLQKLLEAYREGQTTEVALPGLFKTSVKDFEAGYLQFLDERVAGLSQGTSTEPELTAAEIERGVEEHPKDPLWLGRAALLKVQVRRRDEARKLAREALEIDKHCASAAIALAQLDLRAEEPEKAIEKLTSALNPEKPDRLLLEKLIPLLVKTEQWEAALTNASLAEKAFPEDVTWTMALAEILPHAGDGDRRKMVLERLAYFKSDDPDYRLQRAELAWADKDLATTAKYAGLVLEIDVLDAKAHWLLGEGLARSQPEESLQEFQIACELDPQLAEAWAGWAEVLAARGRMDAAREKAAKALELDAKNDRAKGILKR